MAFLTTVRFLTILPLGKREPSSKELGASLVFFPLVGLLLGLVLAGLDAIFTQIWPAAVSSALLITSLLIITGAMHMEGFLDTCDGLLGGASRERRLEIMRDEHVGAFAMAGGICLVLLKWAALSSLPMSARFPSLVLFPALSRWAMVLAVRAFPYARAEGLGMAFHQESTWPKVLIAAVIALGSSFILAGVGGTMFFVAATLLAWLLGKWMAHLLGGLTGDTYGALNEVTEVIVLIAVAPITSAGLIQGLP